jgi:hypothetical protein
LNDTKQNCNPNSHKKTPLITICKILAIYGKKDIFNSLIAFLNEFFICLCAISKLKNQHLKSKIRFD